MGISQFDFYYPFVIYEFYTEFESLLKDSKELNIKNISRHLFSFISSEKFHLILLAEIDKRNESRKINIPFYIFIFIYEAKEKYLSLKIFLNILEEMKNMKFDHKIKNIYTPPTTECTEIQNKIALFLEEYPKSEFFISKLNYDGWKKFFDDADKYYKENKNLIDFLF